MTFFLMHSGQEIDLENLTIDQINLGDISHHLTKICRYGGGLDLRHHYSVANHSIALYYYAMDNNYPIEVQRSALMHDASEAWLGDINGILKQLLPDYLKLEKMVTNLVENKYNLSQDSMIKSVVSELDRSILLDEAKAFLPHRYERFKSQYPNIEPLGINLYPEQELSITKSMFLHCCEQLNIFD